MSFSVYVAADNCSGEKINLRFGFDTSPSAREVLARATAAFTNYFADHGIRRTFSISIAVIFNEGRSIWNRLERSSQIHHNCQIYVFQHNIPDVPAEIPDGTDAEVFLEGFVPPSPSRSRSESPRAQMPRVLEPRRAHFRPHSPTYADMSNNVDCYRHKYGPTSGIKSNSSTPTRQTAFAADVDQSQNTNSISVVPSSRRTDNNNSGGNVNAQSQSAADSANQAGSKSPNTAGNSLSNQAAKSPSQRRSASPGVVNPSSANANVNINVVSSTRRSSSQYAQTYWQLEQTFNGGSASRGSSAGRAGSILRDEREKVDRQMNMPLDEMRIKLKLETAQMHRSISRSNSPARN